MQSTKEETRSYFPLRCIIKAHKVTLRKLAKPLLQSTLYLGCNYNRPAILPVEVVVPEEKLISFVADARAD